MRGTTPITNMNAKVPADTATPHANDTNAIRICLVNIVFVPPPSRVLDKGCVDILLVFAHLYLDRCRIGCDLLLSDMIKEHQNADSKPQTVEYLNL